MAVFFAILFCLIIVSIFVFMIIFFVNYSFHVSYTKGKRLKYDYVTFDTFMRVFNRYKDNISYNGSWFSCYSSDIFIDDDVIVFNNKCMILYPIDYIKFRWWYKYKNNNRQKGLWEE